MLNDYVNTKLVTGPGTILYKKHGSSMLMDNPPPTINNECCPRTVISLIPLVPFLPTSSMVLNIILIVNLNYDTWIRFSAWIVVGLIVYFSYSVRHSSSRRSTIGQSEDSNLIDNTAITDVRSVWGSHPSTNKD